MRYPTDLPAADPQDLAAAFSSDAPLTYVAEREAALDTIRQWVETEQTKWAQARATLESFTTPVPDADDRQVEAVAESHKPFVALAARQNGHVQRPKTRRASLLVVFHESPDRAWRTRELAAELESRGWAGPSGNEANKVSRSLASMVEDGEIVNVRKGVYKLRTQPAEARPSTLQEASL
jgi:hypothetical protein